MYFQQSLLARLVELAGEPVLALVDGQGLLDGNDPEAVVLLGVDEDVHEEDGAVLRSHQKVAAEATEGTGAIITGVRIVVLGGLIQNSDGGGQVLQLDGAGRHDAADALTGGLRIDDLSNHRVHDGLHEVVSVGVSDVAEGIGHVLMTGVVPIRIPIGVLELPAVIGRAIDELIQLAGILTLRTSELVVFLTHDSISPLKWIYYIVNRGRGSSHGYNHSSGSSALSSGL